MDKLIIYLLQSALCLTIFYLFYVLLLKKETFYSWNRLYLFITGCFSVIIPLLRVWMPANGYTKEITYFMAPVFATGKTQSSNPGMNLFQIIEIIYFAVAVLLIVKFLIRLIQIFLLTKRGDSIIRKGQKIVLLEKGNAPFSFLNTIFLSREQLHDSSIDSVIAHEKMHVRQFHSADMILFELIKIMQWFNPFAWRFKKEIEAQHEFSADSGLVSEGINLNEYKNVLAAYSFGGAEGALTNNFNSLLKRRLEMLSQKRSSVTGKVKLFFTLPLMAVLVLFIGTMNGSISFANGRVQDGPKGKIMKQCDQMPVFPGGDEALGKFMINNIVYPDSAKTAGIQGKVFVAFVIEEDGSVTNVEILKKAGSGLDEEAVRVIKLMPKWTPGKDKGKLVRVRIAIPVVFALK